MKGDPLNDNFVGMLKGVDAGISCIGAIGFNEEQLRGNYRFNFVHSQRIVIVVYLLIYKK